MVNALLEKQLAKSIADQTRTLQSRDAADVSALLNEVRQRADMMETARVERELASAKLAESGA